MKNDTIKEIKIDEEGRLCVIPLMRKFPQIFRSAMEIHWDDRGEFLYSPINMKNWSYFDWFRQIMKAVQEEYGYLLLITDQTNWVNVPNELKSQLKQLSYN